MKPLTEKILKSGLIDSALVEMMEKWGTLPNGASELVNDDALKNATKEQLYKLAEDIGDEVEKTRILKETHLDLDRIRWPTQVSIPFGDGSIIDNVPAVVDRMGRLYFRVEDVDESWFIPGHHLTRTAFDKNAGVRVTITERVLEKTALFIEDQLVCYQVSVQRLA